MHETSYRINNRPVVLLVGQGGMPVQCAELLVKNGFDIAGMHSPDEPLRKWAETHNMPHFCEQFKQFESRAKDIIYDYLFSIVNFAILRAELLQTPRCFAINYHDGPLPRYAGSHAIDWALYNREESHGITWHIMEERVDAGDILKQVIFPIKPEETHRSLEMKCYLAAMRAFKELVIELKEGRWTRTPQDLTKRTFYKFSQVPPKFHED
jgi:methionyl-tRNA formyltransferase